MKTQNDPLNALLSTLKLAGDCSSSSLALAPRRALAPDLPAPVPASIPTVVTVSPPAPPILKGRPRTGAVASLPKDERDMVCRMISKSVPYKRIAEALAELGFEVTERNISNWVTHGGYAEWCALYNDALQTSLRQDDLLEYHRNENSPDLAEVGLQSVAVRLSELLLRQAASSQDIEANLSKLEPAVQLLCRINKELFNAQKYRDDCQSKAHRTPARIKGNAREQLIQCEKAHSAEPKLELVDTPTPDTNSSPVNPAAAQDASLGAQPLPAELVSVPEK
jgi:hypothetical protein